MKLAVVTRSDDNIKEMSDMTHPLIKSYADKCGADFIIFDHEPLLWTDDKRPHYRILKAQELLKDYNRILFIDTDTVISPNCPNIFKEVPYDCIGTIFEDKGSRQGKRRSLIKNIQNRWGDVGWTEGYTNAGTFVISDCHSNIFDSHNGEYCVDWGSVDIHLSYMARKNNYKFHELPFQWNHMTMFSEAWNNHADRFNSYIIHYAGAGTFDAASRMEQIRNDISIVKGD